MREPGVQELFCYVKVLGHGRCSSVEQIRVLGLAPLDHVGDVPAGYCADVTAVPRWLLVRMWVEDEAVPVKAVAHVAAQADDVGPVVDTCISLPVVAISCHVVHGEPVFLILWNKKGVHASCKFRAKTRVSTVLCMGRRSTPNHAQLDSFVIMQRGFSAAETTEGPGSAGFLGSFDWPMTLGSLRLGPVSGQRVWELPRGEVCHNWVLVRRPRVVVQMVEVGTNVQEAYTNMVFSHALLASPVGRELAVSVVCHDPACVEDETVDDAVVTRSASRV